MGTETIRLQVLSGSEQGIRYISGLNVFTEMLHNGRFVCKVRSATGGAKEGQQGGSRGSWVDPLIGYADVESFQLEMDGQVLNSHWSLGNICEMVEAEELAKHCVVELKHDVRPVRVKIHTRISEYPFIERWIEISNEGQQPSALSLVSPVSGLLWIERDYENLTSTDSVFEIGTFVNNSFGYEGDFRWRPLPVGTTLINNVTGRSGWGIPFAMLHNKVNGEYFIVDLEWSANWFLELTVENGGALRSGDSLMPTHSDSALFLKMGPLAPPPIRILESGETVTSPIVHFGHLHGNFDSCVKTLHTYLRQSVLRKQPLPKKLLIGAGLVVAGDTDWLKSEIEIAHAMGMEYFLVDAGWYGTKFNSWYDTVGDWSIGSWLNGDLSTIRDFLHDKGMLFGLWIEPESIGSNSALMELHPDWVLMSDNEPVGHARVLDFSNTEVQQWVESEIIRVIEVIKPDILKLDYNSRNINNEGQSLKSGYIENTQWRHVQVLYSIFDRVAERFPNIILENCAAGGGRNDLGMVRRFDVSCQSDYTVMPRSLKALNNLTIALPPEVLRYYFGHWPGYDLYGDVDTQLRVCLFSNPLFVGFGHDEDTAHTLRRKVLHYVDLYKNFVRPIMPECLVHHHTGPLGFEEEADWCVMEYVSSDTSKAYVGIFKLKHTNSNTYHFASRGVHPGYNYKITLDNSNISFNITGYELRTIGLDILLDNALTSELLLIERC